MQFSENGFTLMELLITIAIVSILASVAVPTYHSMISTQKLVGAAEKIKADMEWARSIAIRDNTDVLMKLTATGAGNWCYGFDDSDNNCDCTATGTSNNACTVIGVNTQNDQTSYGDVTLNSTVSGNKLNFESRGVADNRGVLTFVADSKTVTININRLGRSTICSNDISQFNNCP